MAGLLSGRPNDGMMGSPLVNILGMILAPKVMGGLNAQMQGQSEMAARQEEMRRKQMAQEAVANLAKSLVTSKMVGPYADPKKAFKTSLLPLQDALPQILQAQAQGFDPSGLLDTYRTIDSNDTKRMEANRGVVVAEGSDLVNPMVGGLLHRTPQSGYTLGQNQTRYDGNNNPVASVAGEDKYIQQAPDRALVRIPGAQPQTGGVPRGIRNNNPGNIEDGPFAKSLPGYAGSDGRFARFQAPEQGQAAAVRLLQSYGQRGISTIGQAVERWAPEKENGASTGNYVASVARAVGVNPGDRINLADPAVAQKVASAMFSFENGGVSSGGPQVVMPATGGSNAPPPQAGLTPLGNGWFRDKIGRVYKQNENGGMSQTTGVTDPVVQKTTEIITGANDILAALDRYDEAVRALTPRDWGPLGQYVGDPAKYSSAKAAATDLQMRLKGPAGYNLGVLAGPDMAVLEGVVADPAKFKTAVLRNQVRPALKQLAAGIGASYRTQRESFRAAGGDPAGLPPIYVSQRRRAQQAAAPRQAQITPRGDLGVGGGVLLGSASKKVRRYNPKTGELE